MKTKIAVFLSFSSVSRLKICSTLTRALERGGQILPSPHVFCEYLSKYSFDRRDFCNTQNKRRIIWCKNWRRVDFWGSIFKPPKSALSFFAELMPWRGCPGPPSHRLTGPGRSLGGGAAGRWGKGAGRALGGAGRALGGETAPRGLHRPDIATDGYIPWLSEWTGWEKSIEPGYGHGHGYKISNFFHNFFF